MALKLMYITKNPEVAKLAESCGVDRVFVDLETLGKEERQGHLDTVISKHCMEDVSAIRDAITRSELLVRVDPVNQDSKQQIDEVIARGADIVMLPMFTTAEEVHNFVEMVDGRARTCLLLETPQAMVRIDDILSVPGIDEVHIGLNDLHLGLGLDFMFELLSSGIVEYICKRIRAHGIPYGFGGIARIGYGMLPAEKIICEHYRLQSGMAILSRSFCDANRLPIDEVRSIFQEGIRNIRAYEASLSMLDEECLEQNFREIHVIVQQIVSARRRG